MSLPNPHGPERHLRNCNCCTSGTFVVFTSEESGVSIALSLSRGKYYEANCSVLPLIVKAIQKLATIFYEKDFWIYSEL